MTTKKQTKFKRGDLVMYLNPAYSGLMCFEPVTIRKVTRNTSVGDFYEIQFKTGKMRFSITHAMENQLFTPEEQKELENSSG
jgi:hypothetical protein